MKKKILITVAIIAVLLTSIAGMAFAAKSMFDKKHPSDYNIGITYEEAVQADKPMLALFYVDWCGYCLKFMPRYKILSTLYKDKYNFVMVNAENPAYRKLVEDNLIGGYPTLYILDPKFDNRVHLTQGLYGDLGLFRNELDRYARIRNILDKAEVK